MKYEFLKLGDLCQTGAGGTPLKSKKEYYIDGNIPWLLSGEVNKKEICEAENFITSKGLENSSAKIFPKNTVLIAMYGATAGQVGILRFEASTNQAVCGILPCKHFLPEFLYYFFLYKKKELVAQAVGNAQPNISQEKIKNTYVPTIPIDAQKKIVRVLDEALESISSAESKVKSNKENSKAIFESYLKSIFLTPGASWQKKTLEEVCLFKNGQAHEQHIDENGKYILINSKFISSNGATFKKTSDALAPLSKGDIAFVMSDVPNGKALAKCFLVDQNDTYSLNQRIGVISSSSFENKFLYYQLNRNDYLLSFNNGENQTNLRKPDILKCPLWIPPREEQINIILKLDSIFTETNNLEHSYAKKLSSLDELRSSILHNAFEGEH